MIPANRYWLANVDEPESLRQDDRGKLQRQIESASCLH